MRTFTYYTPNEFINMVKAEMGQDDGYNEAEKTKLRGGKLTRKVAGSHMKMYRHTRNHNGETFLSETRNTKVVDGGSVVRHGYFLECLETGQKERWKFESWTLDEGHHVLNFSAIIDEDGVQQAPGSINYFGMGMGVLDDQSYVTEQLKTQLKESQKIADYWDVKE
jgi:hypothetical protein